MGLFVIYPFFKSGKNIYQVDASIYLEQGFNVKVGSIDNFFFLYYSTQFPYFCKKITGTLSFSKNYPLNVNVPT